MANFNFPVTYKFLDFNSEQQEIKWVRFKSNQKHLGIGEQVCGIQLSEKTTESRSGGSASRPSSFHQGSMRS